MRKLDTKAYIGVLRELCEEGKEVRLLITGSSMSPFLIHERDTIYFKTPDSPLKKGDMVFYQRDNGQFVMHRILKVRPEGLYLIGDAQTVIEGPLTEDHVFARVTQVIRKGKVIRPVDFWWNFFAKVWIRIIPLRPLIVKLYRRKGSDSDSNETQNS